MKTYDTLIIGGGIIGASLAFELAERKQHVLLVDRQQPGMEASWAAAGMLAPGPEYADALALVPLAQESFQLYPEFASRIEERSGLRVGFHKSTALQVYFGSDGERERDESIAVFRRMNQPMEAISIVQAIETEPGLSKHITAAALSPVEGFVDNRKLTEAAILAAKNAGAELRSGIEVTGLRIEKNKCTGVVTANETIVAKNVAIAAGAFSSLVAGMAQFAPTRPIRGQMLALRSKSLSVSRVVRSVSGYVVPRDDGRLIAGSTVEDAGFEKKLTAAGIQKILNAVVELISNLTDAEILESWSGLRPDTPDHLPILGQSDVEGLFVATGHYRNGILLAPITSKLMADLICGGKTDLDLRDFSPLRFSRH
ncbi:MAG: glycine oxidase ThiO [Acidobacteria bacterium]|nr:glycine oxidase ThiO [Acidobacteriota bacterium]